MIPRHIREGVTSFVLDAEVVAVSTEPDQLGTLSLSSAPRLACVLTCAAPLPGKILPFQVLSTRKRKDAADSEITVKVGHLSPSVQMCARGVPLRVRHPVLERRAAPQAEPLHVTHSSSALSEAIAMAGADVGCASTMRLRCPVLRQAMLLLSYALALGCEVLRWAMATQAAREAAPEFQHAGDTRAVRSALRDARP
eukprot:3106393-Rhodomonas_salina.2